MRFEKVSFTQFESALRDCCLDNGDFEMLEKISDRFEAKDIWTLLKLPKRETMKAAGYDFFAPFDFTLKPGETIKIPTGIRVILDDDKYLMCAPRSGLGFKYRAQLDNTIGVIDADYSDSDNEGHIMVKLTNDSKVPPMKLIDKIKKKLGMKYVDPVEKKTFTVCGGHGMFQGIISQYFKTEDDVTNEVRNGGFGSTTK